MIRVERVIYGDAGGSVDQPRGEYHRIAITIGRQHDDQGVRVIEGAEYEVDGEPVSREWFTDLVQLLALPAT